MGYLLAGFVGFILGVAMSQPTVIAVPPSFAITAIGTSGTLYVMPMVDQN
jgi:hypothetical protein